METTGEKFAPLETEIERVSDLERALPCLSIKGDLPRCLAALVAARRRLGRSLILAGVLAAGTLGELAVLLLLPGPEPMVVWEERPFESLTHAP